VPGEDALVRLDVVEGEPVGVLLRPPVHAPEVAEVVVELVEDGEGVVEVLALRREDLLPVGRVDREDAPPPPLGRPDPELGALDPVVLAEEVQGPLGVRVEYGRDDPGLEPVLVAAAGR
jgi:hypothetical protein